MNDRIKKLYAAIVGNQIIAVGTNGMDFYKSFSDATGYKLGYHTFRKYFQAEAHYLVTIEGKEYYFQKVK